MSDLNTYQALDVMTKKHLFTYSFRGTPALGDVLDGEDGEYIIKQVGGQWVKGYPVIWVEKV